MLLVIDVGNSNMALGLYDGNELRGHWRVLTTNYHTADELRIMLAMLLEHDGLSARDVTGCCISSVVPQLNRSLIEVTEVAFGVDPVMVGPGVKTGLVLRCANPKEVGADRIVNSVAAFEEYGGPLIIVDFGTATTFDVVSENAEWRGAIIFPGIQLAANALFEKCAKLPRVDVTIPAKIIGKDTVENINAGLTYGYACLVDGLVERIAEEMGAQPKVVATGGLAATIASITRRIDCVDPFLTLKGLRAIYHKNHRADFPTDQT